ncbi:amino acid permease [Thermoplasma volcanium GSS1]|uniref:Amino acid permease n=1 Tax=Thermoplasma volcanium (strain ATCC 51530 / DSM 4299 / JCM 9571 / NBRC 15438 / GSS1) TaxID=273116 RepID=Q97BE6_THEVO|nr:APC family permease [Thermoplasma volcanium]BAB59652.1 amino acid permease [Thermoplasma volcanium GSS1]
MNVGNTTYESKRLHGDVSTWGAIAEEISAMAPACDTVAFMTSAAMFAYVLTPLAFLIATLTMYLEVNTLYHLSKHHASAGGYYGYISTALGARSAVLSGFLYVMYQAVSTAAIPVYVAGILLPGIMSYFFHITLPIWIWIPFIAVFIVAPIILAILGIRPQMKYVKYASIFEVAFLGVLGLIIILRSPDNTIQVFNPFAWSSYYSEFKPIGGPFAGLGLGMIFGLTSFIGYGGSAPLGEEVKVHRSITRALVLGLLIVGAILTEVAYALTVGWGTTNMATFATSAIPGVIVATMYAGITGGLLLSLVAFNSAFSDSVAMQANAGRVYFAMARDRVIPEKFSKISKRFGSPYVALIFIAVVSIATAMLIPFLVEVAMGYAPLYLITSHNIEKVNLILEYSFDLLSTMALVGLISVHLLLNTSVMTLFRRLKEKHYGLHKITHPIEHYLLPSVATGIFVFVLYESIIPPVFPITQAVEAIVVYIVFMIIYIVFLGRVKPDVIKNAGKTVNLVKEEDLER